MFVLRKANPGLFNVPGRCCRMLIALSDSNTNQSFWNGNTRQLPSYHHNILQSLPNVKSICGLHTKSLLQKQNSGLSEDFRLIYEGPLSLKIKIIKLFSLSTATAAVMAGPILVLYGKESVPFIGKMMLAATVVTMGVTTTLILHWITRVYVHKMFFNPQSKVFAAETYNFFGRSKTHVFSVEDILIPELESAFSTFEAKGNKFFVHMDLREAEQIMKYVREYNLKELSS